MLAPMGRPNEDAGDDRYRYRLHTVADDTSIAGLAPRSTPAIADARREPAKEPSTTSIPANGTSGGACAYLSLADRVRGGVSQRW